MFQKIGLVVIFLAILWTLVSYFFEGSIEQPAYEVVVQKDDYEVRTYAPFLVAETTIKDSSRQSLGDGFRILADYIFGNNIKVDGDGEEKLAMTAPVFVEESEKLAMTAPVFVEDDIAEGAPSIMSFVMPSAYTKDTLPRPNNDAVRIVERPERTMAVLTFSWWRTDKRVEEKKQELLDLLTRDGVEVTGSIQYAGYNAPFTAPWLNRHEVLVEIER